MIEQAPYRDAVNSEQGLMSTSWTRWLEKVGLYVGTLSDAGTANPTTNLWVGRMFYRTDLTKPVWCSAITGVWRDSAATIVP